MNKETAIKPAKKASGTVNIHGREYQTVAYRVQQFREQHPDLSLVTEIVARDEECVVMLAKIGNAEGRLLATGHSEEYRKSSQINKTSALENAETSAIGRALAALGFGGTEFATANEVQNAIRQQSNPTTGEEPPAKRQELTGGPYKSKTALWKAVREFDRTLRSMGDLGELEAFLQTDEVVTLLDQCKVDAPQLLDTGEGLPIEYEPLLGLIGRLRNELANADESWRSNPVLAG
jgi:hypothetical protein